MNNVSDLTEYKPTVSICVCNDNSFIFSTNNGVQFTLSLLPSSIMIPDHKFDVFEFDNCTVKDAKPVVFNTVPTPIVDAVIFNKID